MNHVTRYDLTEDVATGEINITPVPENMNGRYVSWEDYEALLCKKLLVPDGFKLVPEVISNDMHDAFHDTVKLGCDDHPKNTYVDNLEECYTAMLSAAGGVEDYE